MFSTFGDANLLPEYPSGAIVTKHFTKAGKVQNLFRKTNEIVTQTRYINN